MSEFSYFQVREGKKQCWFGTKMETLFTSDNKRLVMAKVKDVGTYHAVRTSWALFSHSRTWRYVTIIFSDGGWKKRKTFQVRPGTFMGFGHVTLRH